MAELTANDARYLGLLQKALRVCATYKPMFGKGRNGGLTLAQFQHLYGSDSFYKWMGLDSPLMYAAHKAAGGMTSIYRQLGIGCQWVVSAVLQDSLGLSHAQANWEYEVPAGAGKTRKLSLDGRIDVSHVGNAENKRRVQGWLQSAMESVLLDAEARKVMKGAVFEVRQGYKSKDSKRQNADISNASNAYAHQYVPILLLLSNQIDGDVASRYKEKQWLLLYGTAGGSSTDSTYVFCREVLQYDLGAFLERNSQKIKSELELVLKNLLEPQG